MIDKSTVIAFAKNVVDAWNDVYIDEIICMESTAQVCFVIIMPDRAIKKICYYLSSRIDAYADIKACNVMLMNAMCDHWRK